MRSTTRSASSSTSIRFDHRRRTTDHLVLDAYIYHLIYSWRAETKARRVPAAQEQLVPHSDLPGRRRAAWLRHHAGRAGTKRRKGAAVASNVVRLVETADREGPDRRVRR